MAYSNPDANEVAEFQHALSWYVNEYDVSLPNEDDTLFNSGDYHNDWLFPMETPYSASPEESVGGDSWQQQFDSVFSCSWLENYVPPEKENNGVEERECSDQNWEWHESHIGFENEDVKSYSTTSGDDDDPWSFCSSLGFSRDDVSPYQRQDENRVANERELREVAVYESLFGYWPCLYERKPFFL